MPGSPYVGKLPYAGLESGVVLVLGAPSLGFDESGFEIGLWGSLGLRDLQPNSHRKIPIEKMRSAI